MGKKNFVTRRKGKPLPERGGKARYYYKITSKGRAAVIEARRSTAAFGAASGGPGRRGGYADSNVQLGLAGDPATPAEVLTVLAGNRDRKVRKLIAEHLATPSTARPPSLMIPKRTYATLLPKIARRSPKCWAQRQRPR